MNETVTPPWGEDFEAWLEPLSTEEAIAQIEAYVKVRLQQAYTERIAKSRQRTTEAISKGLGATQIKHVRWAVFKGIATEQELASKLGVSEEVIEFALN